MAAEHEPLPQAQPAGVQRPPLLPGWDSIAVVALGGMIGAALRYSFVILFPHRPGRFPLTIFAENILGAFLLGYVLVLILQRVHRHRHLHPLLCIGVLGSFTTFSNYSLDTVLLIEQGHTLVAIAYAASSIAIGVTAAFTGATLAGRRPAPEPKGPVP